MNNIFSPQQISKTGNLDSNLISRQCKLNLMADFMRIKHENPILKQSEIAKQLGYSSSSLQRCRNDINMLSPYRIQSNNTNKLTEKTSDTNFDDNSHRQPDVKRPQMTSNDLKRTQSYTKSDKRNRKILKTGSVQENIEVNDQKLNEILDNNDV